MYAPPKPIKDKNRLWMKFMKVQAILPYACGDYIGNRNGFILIDFSAWCMDESHEFFLKHKDISTMGAEAILEQMNTATFI